MTTWTSVRVMHPAGGEWTFIAGDQGVTEIQDTVTGAAVWKGALVTVYPWHRVLALEGRETKRPEGPEPLF